MSNISKLIKVTDKKGDAIKVVKEKMVQFESAYDMLKKLFDEPIENVFLIIFFDKKAVKLISVSDGVGDESSVEVDFDKIFETLKKFESIEGASYGLSHNHPYTTDEEDGSWVETLISPNDVMTTKKIVVNQQKLYPGLEYEGHFIVNKEMNDKRKIIFFDDVDVIKYSKKVLDKIKAGEK